MTPPLTRLLRLIAGALIGAGAVCGVLAMWAWLGTRTEPVSWRYRLHWDGEQMRWERR